ncbi:integrase core domain-containing protein [Xanthobacter sp. NM-25]|uniref:integrase core domain-containing protein n=1 Tax=unclassified Xanthobacter TaxID=2623496 RepID=UPI003FCEF8C8
MESFNGCIHNECINERAFSSLAEARRIIESWCGSTTHRREPYEPRQPVSVDVRLPIP